jgi:protein-S-isoprenylcysteine O-methyltransferase Ste14
VKHLWWLDTVPFLALGGYALTRRSWNPWFLAGMAMALAGFVCWTTARLQLGKSFTPLPEARALVTRGLYAKFRHPVYFFGFVAYTGLFVALRWPLGMLFFAVMYSFQLFRVRKEEAVLEKAFGEEYRRYKAGTWF